MDEWQNQTQPETGRGIRIRWATMLAEALEQIEEKYILGSIDRAEYHSQLAELDDKLGIIGLSLASKPWLKPRV